MNRETLIAIFLGFAGGILVAFLLITIPKRVSPAKQSITENQEATTPYPIQKETELEIDSPDDKMISDTEEVTVSGLASQKARIIVSGPSEDQVIIPEENGKFSEKVSVYEGENLIKITAYFENGNISSQERTVYFTQESL